MLIIAISCLVTTIVDRTEQIRLILITTIVHDKLLVLLIWS